MPADFWANLPPRLSVEGVNIGEYVFGDTPLPIWLPDVFFEDAITAEVAIQSVRIFPNGRLFW